ncbi:MAG: hypothetical protein ACRDY4_04085 [Acidimicrobiia bacterium]
MGAAARVGPAVTAVAVPAVPEAAAEQEVEVEVEVEVVVAAEEEVVEAAPGTRPPRRRGRCGPGPRCCRR